MPQAVTEIDKNFNITNLLNFQEIFVSFSITLVKKIKTFSKKNIRCPVDNCEGINGFE